MNHLHTEKSPYLLQHLDNPVDWYPWGAMAFERARRENRLIFLSIGYSTCHWCHVMAHECFEDPEVAALLNRDYISVKVDREERPDIDQVYMEVCQRLTGGGGWPLTIFMTPDAQPFYAGTYIPKHGHRGRPGLMNLLPWMTTKWQEDPGFLLGASQEIVASMQRSMTTATGQKITLAMLSRAEQLLKNSYDRLHGGFGQAPKFPRPHDLTFLLQRHAVTGDKKCLEMVEQTLGRLRLGGIYDQLGFGFHRYATDDKWLVPHFEKMLYDQAGLLLAYLAGWHITGRDMFAATVREIITYLLRDMTAPEGAFFSAEDADSEGMEGKFYLWTEEEINSLLGKGAHAFRTACNISKEGNYHDEVTGQKTGRNILHLAPHSSGGPTLPLDQPGLAGAREILFAARAKRVRPHLDDKILVAWNGMAISALATAGRLLGEQAYIRHAGDAAGFILTKMHTEDGRLLRRYRQGEAAIHAFAEDYAFLARGLLDLYAADFQIEWVTGAINLAEQLCTSFLDQYSGRLYDTSRDGEELLIRPSSSFDGAIPSAPAVAVEVFSRLSLLTGILSWRDVVERLLAALAADVARYPAGYTQLLQSASWSLLPTREVVIVGRRGEPETEAMLAVARRSRPDRTVVLFKDVSDPQAAIRLAPFTENMQLLEGRCAAYVCSDFTCREPLSDADDLAAILACLPC